MATEVVACGVSYIAIGKIYLAPPLSENLAEGEHLDCAAPRQEAAQYETPN